MKILGLTTLLSAALLLTGCAELQKLFAPAAPAGPARLSSEIPGGPPEADTCTVSPFTLSPGHDVPVRMVVSNDGNGGWCAIRLSQNGAAFAAGLLTATPAHGRVFIHTVGAETSIDYTPARGYSGADGFTTRVLPGYGGLAVSVTVIRPPPQK